jgi:hypothetical protein
LAENGRTEATNVWQKLEENDTDLHKLVEAATDCKNLSISSVKYYGSGNWEKLTKTGKNWQNLLTIGRNWQKLPRMGKILAESAKGWQK